MVINEYMKDTSYVDNKRSRFVIRFIWAYEQIIKSELTAKEY